MLFVHQARVCLIQMNVEGVLLVFDTVALMQADPLALEPIRPHLEDGRRLIFAHGGTPPWPVHSSPPPFILLSPDRHGGGGETAAANDVSTFKRDFNISLSGALSHSLVRWW
jgi:hypothetical protein